MESCGGTNYRARAFQRSGHTVKLISPQVVKPFVKTNKNDANDAQAIVEAASRPSMHFVPIKQVEQQDIQSIHRVRTRVVRNRTALINEIRGLCLEYGIVLTHGVGRVKSSLSAVIASSDNELTPSSRECMQDLYDELLDVDYRLKKLDPRIRSLCRQDERCKRILKISGIGELTATAIVAAVPDPREFRNGRHMSAWLGLVPRQSSSGDKQVLMGISKRGDRYLRTLLIHGARAVLSQSRNLDNDDSRWVGRKKPRWVITKRPSLWPTKMRGSFGRCWLQGMSLTMDHTQLLPDTQCQAVSINERKTIASLLQLILMMVNRSYRLF